MTLLKRLRKSKHQPATVETQIAGLEERSEPELQALVKSDAQEAVREAALGKLEYGPLLVEYALDDAHSRLQQAARKRLGELLESGTLSLEQLRQDLPGQEQLLTISSYSSTAGQQVLAKIDDPALLLQLAIHGASIQMRQAAAERLTTRPELEQLYKAAQGRDKTVYKLAKARLETFKAEDARRAERVAQAQVICDKLEQLARVEADPMYQAKLDKLQQDWAALDLELPAELTERHRHALSQCQQQLDAKADVLAQAEAEQQRREAAQKTLTHVQQQAQAVIQALFEANAETLREDPFTAQLQQLTEQLAEARTAAQDSKTQTPEKILNAAGDLLATLREHGSLTEISLALAETADPQGNQALKPVLRRALKASQWLDSPLPPPVQQARELLAEREEAEKSADRSRRKQIRELEELARRGLGAARGGLVRKARGIHHASLEQRETVENVPPSVTAQLEKLDQAIEQLSDWHEFAVTPKKKTLIEQMQGLAESPLPPEDLARKIHELQDDWKQLSKGVPHADEDLWQEFQTASDRAFEPCREFFEAQAKEREENLAHRDQLIEQLSTYLEGYDWDNPVWKDVEQTFKQARAEWRSYWPVPRHAAKAQEARFEPLMDQLHAKLGEAYSAHKAAKELLVARARELAQAENLNEAIEGAKQLQARWKTIGKCRPREDTALWKAFRQQCDAIFARRQEHFEAADNERRAQQEQAEQIIAQLQALADKPASELRAAQGDVAELKSAFEQLHDLPRARAKAIKDQYAKALDAIDQKRRQAQADARERQWQALFAAADALRRAEVAALQNADVAVAREDARAAMEQVEQWPGSSQQILQKRLDSLADITPEQQAKSTEALRELCIRADIAAGHESPEEDRQARMAYQMQLLQKGLGQQHRDSPDQLLMAWLELRGVEAEAYGQGLERVRPVLLAKP